jgi:hypothetical protein
MLHAVDDVQYQQHRTAAAVVVCSAQALDMALELVESTTTVTATVSIKLLADSLPQL